MIDACLIEVSRRTPTEGIVAQRAYGCRDHAAKIAEEMVHTLSTWTYWGRSEEDVEIIEEPKKKEEKNE
jgi:hypothetical protein